MKRLIVTCIIAAVVPAAAFAAGTPSAQTDCTKLRASMGAAAFTQAYPTFGACVSKYAPVEQQAAASAQATCTAQQADANFASTHSGKTFDQFYGTGKAGKNAFGNCVSTVAKANAQAEQQSRMNPAQTCRGLRTQMTLAVFNQTYGKNANDRNAFGKCVSKTAGAQVQNEVSASKACTAEQTADAATFTQTYGTNDDKTNAFGKCVSTKAKAESTTQQQKTVSAAKACASELKANATTFKTTYGTFGRCVSQKAKS
jgi:hypothetical protein